MSASRQLQNPRRFSVTLETDEHAELLRIAQQTQRSLDWTARQAIREFLDRHREATAEGG
jgi:predicted transcriptional regulator